MLLYQTDLFLANSQLTVSRYSLSTLVNIQWPKNKLMTAKKQKKVSKDSELWFEGKFLSPIKMAGLKIVLE